MFIIILRIAVRVGEWDLRTEPDCHWYINGNEVCSDFHEDIDFSHVIIHDQYIRRKTDHDIALIRLASDLEYTDNVKPVCLPSYGLNTPAGDKVVVAGWGLTENGTYSPRKKN